MPHAWRLYGDAVFTRSIWECYDAFKLATDGNTGTPSGACVFTLFVAILHRLVTSHPPLLDVSTQMQGVGLPTNNSMLYLHGHSLDSVTEMVATAVSAIVSDVIRMIDWDQVQHTRNRGSMGWLRQREYTCSPHLLAWGEFGLSRA